MGLATSAALFAKRQSAISSLNAVCGADRMGCPASAKPTYDSLVTDNTATIGALVGGAAALALGATLLIVSTRTKAPPATVGVSLLPGGAAFAGTF